MIIIENKLRGFIFDLDGVITDTAEYHYRSWKRLADELRISFNRKDNEQFRGISRMKCLDILLGDREMSSAEKRELADRKNSYYRSYLAEIDHNDILPGAEELIEKLRSKGFKIALASASKNTSLVVENLGIKSWFDTISDGYSVEKSKPAPDLFLHTAEKMELKPEECIVVEDAESGVEAARRAGMKVVGIGPEERIGQADYCYQRVADIKLTEILQN